MQPKQLISIILVSTLWVIHISCGVHSFNDKVTSESGQTIDIIYWRNCDTIRLSDFHKKVSDTTKSFISVTGGTTCDFHDTLNSFFVVKLYTEFDKTESWIKDTNLLLESEKICVLKHVNSLFDLHEVITRVTARELKKLIPRTYRDQEFLIMNTITDVIGINEYELTSVYHRETNYGYNSEKQDIWTKKIDSLLISLDAFKNDSIIYVPFK